MSEKIQIEPNIHQQLLLSARSLVESTTSLYSQLNTAASLLPTLSSNGEFHNRVSSGGTGEDAVNLPARFVLKAQTLQSLATVLYKHIETTYSEMVKVDELLAIEIANSLLNDPNTSEEDKQYIRENQNQFIIDLQKQYSEEGGLNEQLASQGLSTEDYFMMYNMIPEGGE